MSTNALLALIAVLIIGVIALAILTDPNSKPLTGAEAGFVWQVIETAPGFEKCVGAFVDGVLRAVTCK